MGGSTREPFRNTLAHPKLVGAMTDLMGAGYRLDHSPLLLAMEKGAEGHTLHGGAVTEAGEPAWPLRYECVGGQMRNQLLTVCLQLTPAPAGAGGAAMPGAQVELPDPSGAATSRTRSWPSTAAARAGRGRRPHFLRGDLARYFAVDGGPPAPDGHLPLRARGFCLR